MVLDVGHVGAGRQESGGDRVEALVRAEPQACRSGVRLRRARRVDAAAGPPAGRLGVEEGASGCDALRDQRNGGIPARGDRYGFGSSSPKAAARAGGPIWDGRIPVQCISSSRTQKISASTFR